MSFLKNKFNISAFEIPEDMELNRSNMFDVLKEKSFKDLEASDDFGHGWVAVDNIFKTDFTMNDACFAENMTIGYRYDKKTVPSALIKKLYFEKLKENKARGVKLNKLEKKDLKEECKNQLILKTLPKPNMTTVILDLTAKRVYINSKSQKLLDDFKGLFYCTFGVDLKPLTYGLEGNNINVFLSWLWKNIESFSGLTIHQTIMLKSAEDNDIVLQGPALEEYLEEFYDVIDKETIQKLGLHLAVKDYDYYLSLNNKTPVIEMKIEPKLKYESVEAALIDNLDHINKVTENITNIVTAFRSQA